MAIMEITKSAPLKGTVIVPGDKSISHRSALLGAVTDGTSRIRNFLAGSDCLSTIDAFRAMGVPIERNAREVIVRGRGLHGLKEPSSTLNMGNSGTTTRLISGLLAPQPFDCVLSGDDSLNSRPMNRVIEPLTRMGASIVSVNGNGRAPLAISGRELKGIHYDSPVASAQVKSAIILAGLYANGETSVTEPYLSRNHTELMLGALGADIRVSGATCSIRPCERLTPFDITIPGDISSAAYFIAAALIVPGSEVRVKNVGINPTRSGILKVCRDMGADFSIENTTTAAGEPTADLIVRHSQLRGTEISGAVIPTLIDEIPIIAVMAAYARGTTAIRDAGELKVKESNRIDTVTAGLRAMGVPVIPTEDGMIIEGADKLRGASIKTCFDHRVAMSFAIAGLAAEGVTRIEDSQCVSVSYPGFFDEINQLRK